VRFELRWVLFVPMSDRYVRFGVLDLSVSHFFVPKFGVLPLHLKSTKHMGLNMMFGEEYMCEQKVGGLKKVGERGV
jgi:hypothetical protein